MQLKVFSCSKGHLCKKDRKFDQFFHVSSTYVSSSYVEEVSTDWSY